MAKRRPACCRTGPSDRILTKTKHKQTRESRSSMKKKMESNTPAGTGREVAVLSPEGIRAGLAALQQTQASMPYLAGLTSVERRHLRKIGPRTQRMVETHVEAARLNRESLPASFDLRQFESDAAVTAALTEYLSLLEEMRDQARDTLFTFGTRAVQAATEVRQVIKVVSRRVSGVSRVATELAAHTRRQTPKAELEKAPTPTPPAAAAAAVVAPVTPSGPPVALPATAPPTAPESAKAA